MEDTARQIGTCPQCDAALSRPSVLIEYEVAGETRRFVECPTCHEPVRPQ